MSKQFINWRVFGVGLLAFLAGCYQGQAVQQGFVQSPLLIFELFFEIVLLALRL